MRPMLLINLNEERFQKKKGKYFYNPAKQNNWYGTNQNRP